MKFKINEEEVFELNPTKCKVLCHDINADEFDADMKRRVRYIVEHKYEQCMKRLREEWMPKLRDAGVDAVPLDDDKFAEFVFARPDYKDRKARMLEDERQ